MRSSLSNNTAAVFLIGADPDRPTVLPWPALAALSAADAVLYDGDVDPAILALVPQHSLVEPASADVTRARKLADEGWRVIWLIAGNPSRLSDKLAEAGIKVHTIAGIASDDQRQPLPTPQHYATALTGLAG